MAVLTLLCFIAASGSVASKMVSAQDTAPPTDLSSGSEASKVGPRLARWIESRNPDERELFVVSFRDDLKLPRFPDIAADEPEDSPANALVRAQTEEMIAGIVKARNQSYEQLREQLERDHQATVKETFWITRAMLIEAPLAEVAQLANRPDVIYITAEKSGDPPPNADPADDVDDGRLRIASDPYFSQYGTSGWIGLLDTNVSPWHVQLTGSPSPVRFRKDCVNCVANYCSSNVDGACLKAVGDQCDHGTSSAAILVANASQGQAYRGVTGATLGSYKVYPADCNVQVSATLRGFESAIYDGNHVIVAEIQNNDAHMGPVATAADGAFDAGKIVIAANGNFGPGAGTVRSPANAHKAIGVGAYFVKSLTPYDSQGRGPTGDGRIKPDLQAPSWTETASSASTTALKVFGGTSGATPYAAGMALMWRNFLLAQTGAAPEPGLIYAHLILSGPLAYPAFDNTSGVGRAAMPNPASTFFRGKIAVGHGQVVDIPLNLGSVQRSRLEAALWWPEAIGQDFQPSHNTIQLRLLDPGGVVRASSTTALSVFQRASTTGSLSTGTWKLRITGADVPVTPPQVVYWAAYTQ